MPRKKSENPRNILNWPKEDRPREKLVAKGRRSLTDTELLAILIGSGTSVTSAVDMAREILAMVHNNITELAKTEIKDLMKMKGMGKAKAIKIVAALELGRRRNDHFPIIRKKITGSRSAYEVIKQYLLDNTSEEFWILLLNRANDVIRAVQVSAGGVSGVAVDTKVIFKLAIESLASSLILVHNHPSGQLKPSEADQLLTLRIMEAGNALDIPVLDHIIFTDTGYYSFTDDAAEWC